MPRVYKIIYNVVDKDVMSDNYGYLIEKVLKCNSDRKSTRLNSSHIPLSRMPSSA